MAVGDWVPMTGYGSQLTLDLDPTLTLFSLDQLIVGTGDDQGLSAEVAIVETQAEVLVKRVVGGVVFRAAVVDPTAVLIKERIRVGLLDDEGTPSFFAYDSLRDASQANEPFLWERLSCIELGEAATAGARTWPQADVGHPGWSMIDVRVARKLQRSEALFYSVQVSAFSGGFVAEDLFTVVPCLRAWARALG